MSASLLSQLRRTLVSACESASGAVTEQSESDRQATTEADPSPINPDAPSDSGTALDDEIPGTLKRLARIVRGSTVEWQPYCPDRDDQLATFDPPDGTEVVDRYPVNQPYAAIAITHSATDNTHTYHPVEPDLDEFEAELLDRVRSDIRAPLLHASETDQPPEQRLRTELIACLERYGISVDNRTVHALWYYLHRDFRGYGRLDPLLRDDCVEDISCDGHDRPIFVYHDSYADIETPIAFDKAEVDDTVVRLAQGSGEHISVGDPIVEATLADGSRAELSFGGEITPHGSAFTIRQYADEPFTPIDLLQRGTFSAEQLAYCWLCLEHNKNLLVAGGTAAGKTTSLNAISMFIPPGSKVVTIEDTRELTLAHDNWLAAVTRDDGDDETAIDMYDLLRSALRHRPAYLLVGEVRGAEAATLFQAMNTGHTTLSTIHGDSIETVVNRLESEPINVPRSLVQSVDCLLVQTQQRLDGRRVRRARTIGELRGVDDRTDELDYASAFEWEPATDSFARYDSDLLDSIRDERGWSEAALRQEFQHRVEFLRTLATQDVTDYQQFTALVGDYYAAPEGVSEEIVGTSADAAAANADDTPHTADHARTDHSTSTVRSESERTPFDPAAVTNRP
jgi:Type IV secretory pathway, VirB11 components, and related ATPases involved in archaeal flagella biosynthesis